MTTMWLSLGQEVVALTSPVAAIVERLNGPLPTSRLIDMCGGATTSAARDLYQLLVRGFITYVTGD